MRRRPCLPQILICLCLLSLFPKSSGQVINGWQPVPKADLELKDNPANPGSAAMILERQVYTDDEKRLQTEWVRIKIFTEAGRDYADVVIPYFEKRTSIEDVRGRTVRPDGTVIPFNGAVFDKIIVKYKKFRYHAKAFTLPGVEIGSVIEYSYALHWNHEFPGEVTHPERYVFEYGSTVPTTTWTIQQDLFTRHAVFVIRPVKGGSLDFAKVRLPDNFPSWQPNKTMRMEVNDVAAIEQEEYMPPESFLNSRVHFYYRVGPIANYWRSMSRANAELYEKFIEKTSFLEREANKIAPPGEPAEMRLRKLYTRVQQVRNLSYEPSRTEKEKKVEHLSENKSAEDIFRHNYGNANEINLLFTALARAAGFDASVVEVANRASTRFQSEVLDVSQFDAMVVVLRLNGQILYFDPATRYCPYGLVPWFETDTVGLRWDKVGGDLLLIRAPETDSSAVERTADLKLQPDGGIEGTVEIVYTGQEALDMRLFGNDEDEAGRRKLLEDEIKELTPPGAKIDLDTVTGWEDSEKPLRVQCHLHAPRFATVSRQRMLLPMAVFQANRTTPLAHSYRVQPVYFQHGYREKDTITISAPSGYRLEALPSAAEYNTSFAAFNSKSTGEAGSLRFERRAEMKEYYFPVKSYGALREYFQRVRQSDAENLVLHKTDSAQSQ
jgi:hypothetical protein